MSPENLKHLFNPQLTVADRFSEPRGSGLGLAICQKIVSLHQGELQVTSAVARGTTIEIDFPTASLEAGSAMESLRPDVLRSGLRQQRDRGASPQPQASAERIK